MADDQPRYDIVAAAPAGQVPAAPQAWGDAPPPVPEPTPLERPLAAMRRYKWLMAGVFALALLGGLVATRFVNPKYEVLAAIWVASETPMQRTGPVNSGELLNSAAWVELLRSYRITDAVVRKLSLYIKPDNGEDAPALAGLSVADRFVPGEYELEVNDEGSRWTLALPQSGVTESGGVNDSIAPKLGLQWVASQALMSRYRGKSIPFTISTPRETSVELMQRLDDRLPEGSNFLWVSLEGEDPQLAARTLNTWVDEYVKVAGELKKRHMVEFASILEGQLDFAENALRGAESALEVFRIQTITLPTEGGPVAAGVEATRDPAMSAYFDKKIEYDNLRGDREALEKVLRDAAAGRAPYESALLIPSVAQNQGAEQLRASFKALYDRQAELSAARQVYTDQYPAVRNLASAVEDLKTQTIPQQATSLLAQLRERERDVNQRIAGASRELRSIPVRTIEEMRLRRSVAVAEELYTTLKSRHAEARLAEASAAPDVNVLDSAVAPLQPTKSTTPGIILMAVAIGLAAAIAIALLLDRVDTRLRYPSQASNELGLQVVAAVPLLPSNGARSPEEISQLVESFRTLRMGVTNATGPQLALAVSSPSPGDGKSFVSSNLAMSFAEAGFRTLLVDGDTRRGTLHETFGLRRTPGLTDHLAGFASREAVIRPTEHERLSVIASGNPRRTSPELLSSPALTALMAALRTEYDAVIFDTPPLAAGIDGYAIAAATGNLLVVLRIGQTEKRMAAAKLLLVDRLPISVVGTVLNAAPSDGEYEYYGYTPGYAPLELEPGREVAPA